uniref:Ribosomal protein L29 n=1 Tax=Spermothamnion repens TaxID=31383 RepID=A0A4D6X0N7_9FLOR|nr:ribosomal protein L29 [Spermothamnion repens]
MSQSININENESHKTILDLKKELVFYKIKKATKQDIKPHITKNIKHRIAQILTKTHTNTKSN